MYALKRSYLIENNDVRASSSIRSRILYPLTVFIRASRGKFAMTVETSRVVIPETHGHAILGLINISGEIAPCLRVAFDVYVRASSLALVRHGDNLP